MKKRPIICVKGKAAAFAILDGDPLCVECLYKAVENSGNPDLLAKITPLVDIEEESDSFSEKSATG